MNKKDKEDVKAIVEEALKKNNDEHHTIDFGDVMCCMLGSAMLLGVFGAVVALILSVAGII